MAERTRVTIYTDGGSKPNPGPGGWGAILIQQGARDIELSGSDPDTTNNRMELTAAIEALRALDGPCNVTLYTDSQYVRNGITSWLAGWIRRGWRTASGKAPENEDLWHVLDAETRRHTIDWKWVRGHAGNVYNERVDQLATRARLGFSPDEESLPRVDVPAAPPLEAARFEVVLRIALVYKDNKPSGGWAAMIRDNVQDSASTYSGRLAAKSSNHLWLLAAHQALTHLPDGGPARAYTPDDYLYNGITQWILGWRKRNWRTKDGGAVKYRAEWEALAAEADRCGVTWVHENDHTPPETPNLYNLAEEAARSA